LVDLCNKIYLSGWGGGTNAFATCNSAGFTTGMDVTFDAYQPTTDGSDFYLMVLEDDASALVYASFMGGGFAQEHVDGGTSRFDRKGKVYQSVCAGCNYPLPGYSDFPIEPPGTAVSPTNNSNCNNAVFKMDFNLPIVVADFDTPPIGCEPFTYTFNNTSVSQNFTTYQWSFGDGSTISTAANPTHTYTGSGTFTITLIVSDTATCNFGDTISKLITILGDTTYSLADLVICPGVTEQVGLLPNPDTSITYSWITGSGSLTDTSVSNPFADPIVTTNYTLLINSGVCTDTVHQTIIVNTPLLTVSNDTTLCDGANTITLYANSFGTSTDYIWSSNNAFTDTLNSDLTSDSLNVTPTVPTMYYVQVNNSGCITYDSILVDLASSQIELSAIQYICEGDTISIDVTNLDPTDTLTYDWSNDLDIISGDSTSSIVVSPVIGTWFYIESINSAGCLLTDSILIQVSNLPTTAVFATADMDTIPNGTSVGLHASPGGYTYSWTPAGTLDDPNSQNPFATPEGTTTYIVTVTEGPCSKSDSVTIIVTDVICGQPDVYVPNAFTPDGNGNNDVVRVRGNNIKELVFRIYDRWGELVFETNDQAVGWDGTYKGKHGDPAVYVYYLDIICIDEEEYFEKGNITLIR
jgi:gliding motility-associated-like protein